MDELPAAARAGRGWNEESGLKDVRMPHVHVPVAQIFHTRMAAIPWRGVASFSRLSRTHTHALPALFARVN